MDRKSWPWKKKSSTEKSISVLEVSGASVALGGSQGDQDNFKKSEYVQISVEAYSHLTVLENQVKTYEDKVKIMEDQIKELDENLSTAYSEMTTKENLIKQHAKVTEEAVSGWEKAEAEALALKNTLETATHSRLTAEDRASHLDGALKECMHQIRNLKVEHEQKVHDVVLTKTNQWEKVKHDFEVKIGNIEQELRHSAAENSVLSRKLLEHANLLIKMSEEKSQAEADIEQLKWNAESHEREINSLKYEHHVVSKELEIRNEEKNMSMKSADVASKQHLEGVKKIAKLESECQRLRGLIRKKLPGPAAVAQMKLELGRDYRDIQAYKGLLPEYSLDNVQRCLKQNEFLSEHLFAMEEETKMLKETLTKRNNELQASMDICTLTTRKLQSLEAQVKNNNHLKSPPKYNVQIPSDISSSQNISNPPSLTSTSEDGNDDISSCAESWVAGMVSEISPFKKGKNVEKSNKAGNTNHLGLMDDFLEMEKFANLLNSSNSSIDNKPTIINHDISEGSLNVDPLENQVLCNSESDIKLAFKMLQSRISKVLDSKNIDIGKRLEDIERIVQGAHATLNQESVVCVFKQLDYPDSTCNRQDCLKENIAESGKEISKEHENDVATSENETEYAHVIDKELATEISQIRDFLLILLKKQMGTQITLHGGLNQKIEEFLTTTNKIISGKMNLVDFIHNVSHVLAKADELGFNAIWVKDVEVESTISDCIDKAALSDSTSDPEVPRSSNLVVSGKLNARSCNFSTEEFEHIMSEKDNLLTDLDKCTGELRSTKSQLQEKEKLLEEVKSQLNSAENANILAETQLKCMTESYRSLELHAEELEVEVNILRVKAEDSENQLLEKSIHHDVLSRFQVLEERSKRDGSCSEDNIDSKTKQDRNLTVVEEKLAECQNTIFLLGKELKNLDTPYTEINAQSGEHIANVSNFQRMDSKPTDILNSQFGVSDKEWNARSNYSKHGPTKLGSSSCSSGSTPEKHSRVCRLFSSKARHRR